ESARGAEKWGGRCSIKSSIYVPPVSRQSTTPPNNGMQRTRATACLSSNRLDGLIGCCQLSHALTISWSRTDRVRRSCGQPANSFFSLTSKPRKLTGTQLQLPLHLSGPSKRVPFQAGSKHLKKASKCAHRFRLAVE